MKKLIYISLAAITIFLFVQYRKLMDYTIKVKSINFHNLTFGSISGSMILEFYNPSALYATVENYNFDIYVNGKFIVATAGAEPYEVKAKSSSPINVNFTATNTAATLAIITQAFAGSTEPQITIKGAANIKAGAKTKNVKINLTKPLSYFTA